MPSAPWRHILPAVTALHRDGTAPSLPTAPPRLRPSRFLLQRQQQPSTVSHERIGDPGPRVAHARTVAVPLGPAPGGGVVACAGGGVPQAAHGAGSTHVRGLPRQGRLWRWGSPWLRRLSSRPGCRRRGVLGKALDEKVKLTYCSSLLAVFWSENSLIQLRWCPVKKKNFVDVHSRNGLLYFLKNANKNLATVCVCWKNEKYSTGTHPRSIEPDKCAFLFCPDALLIGHGKSDHNHLENCLRKCGRNTTTLEQKYKNLGRLKYFTKILYILK
jgi:hypothetical protein